LFLPLAIDLIATPYGNAERRDATTGGGETKFWVAGEISHECDGVICHEGLLVNE
jgi:hypothetical protein